MPELPEVETARRCLEQWARGRQVRKVTVREPRVLARGGPPLARLVGARFSTFDRRGKHLLIELRQGKQTIGLWSHLGMSGKWLRRTTKDEPPRFSRVQIDLTGGISLHYADLRLFGRLRLVPGAAFARQPVLAALGPDPLAEGVDAGYLAERLASRKKPIKPQLLDQRLTPGVGNIQASEALFRAAIDPRRPARTLTRPELTRLARAIRTSIDFTLKKLLAQIGGTARPAEDVQYVEEPAGPNPFLVYDRAGERCPRCRRGTITRLVQESRSTFYCDRCQK
jgi:formamidopyrimidine-DNA glycosylase